MGEIQNIMIEPCDVFFQIEEQTKIKCIDDVSGALGGKYFLLNAALNAAKFYVWLDTGSSVDPAVSGRTGLQVVIVSGDTASVIAGKIAVVVAANSNFEASASLDVLTITNAVIGETDDCVDGNTGFAFTKSQDGADLDLGYLEGDIELTTELTALEIKAHQTGSNLLAELIQGNVASCGLTMKETNLDKLKTIISGSGGDTHTPSGGTEVFGFGTSKQGLNTVVFAKRLILHPVRLATSDKTSDICFWKSFPMIDSIAISGENPRTVSLNFKTYLDDSKPAEIRQWIFGDWSQYVPVYP